MTEEEIAAWEESVNFVSFRSAMNRSAEDFDVVKTKEEFENWKERYLCTKCTKVGTRCTYWSIYPYQSQDTVGRDHLYGHLSQE